MLQLFSFFLKKKNEFQHSVDRTSSRNAVSVYKRSTRKRTGPSILYNKIGRSPDGICVAQRQQDSFDGQRYRTSKFQIF